MRVSALFLFSALLFAVTAQVRDDLKLIDEFDPRHGCETLSMRLDGLLAEVSKDSGSIAYVVIRKGNNSIDNTVVYRASLAHAKLRSFPLGRYATVLTEGSGDIRVELWVGKNGKKPEVRSVPLNLAFPSRQSRIPFLEDTIEIVEIDGRTTYFPGGGHPCLYSLSSTFVSEFLRVNSNYDLEFLIKAESIGRYRQVVQIFQNEFAKDGVPLERMRLVYGGTEAQVEGDETKLALVQTTFVKRSPER